MRSVNKIIIVGNLTRNPEMRQTPNGQNVSTFGVATNRQWVTKEGEKKNSAEFHECVAWARLAEICANYLKKGHLVYLEGYLKTRSWDSPEGVKKFKTEIVVQDMIMLEKRHDDSGEASDDSTGDDSTAGDDKNEDGIPTAAEAFGKTPKTAPKTAPEITTETSTTEGEGPKEIRTDDPTPISSDTPAEISPIDEDLGL